MKKAKRVYRRKSTIATQTDDAITKYSRYSTLNCRVQLDRLRESLVQSVTTRSKKIDVRTSGANELTNAKRQRSLRFGNTKEISSLVHPGMNKSLGLSRLPSTYSHFAKSITNNEKANSTLADISNNGDRGSLREDNQGVDVLNECIVFTKPGPKSYKEKLLQRCIDLQRPVALNANQSEHAEGNSRLLQTILECPTETTPRHDEIEVNVSEISLNCDIQTEDINLETEALRQLLDNVDDNRNMRTPSEVPSNVENREFPKTRTVQIGCEGFTATIAASKSQQHDTPHQASPEHNGSGEDSSAEQKKYIKIHAHTVHIHNHFYKS